MAGNSFGGYLAWNYAVTFPGKVNKLILLDASGYPSDHSIGVFKLAKNPLTASILKRITPRSFMLKNLKEVYVRDSLISDELVDRYWHMARREGNRQAFIDRVNRPSSDRSHLIKEIQHPTLIMWGDGDTWTDVDHAYLYEKDIKDSKLIMYPNIGHTVMEEDPNTSARDALKFLMEKNDISIE
jgi:pimeloyl-ACP methyl ester carboxylesterase